MPTTFFGRLFCIIYAVVGIPFTLTVMAECGKILADKALQKIYNNLPSGPKALFESDFRGKAVLSKFYFNIMRYNRNQFSSN